MVIRKREGSLTNLERSIVKGLLEAGWRNQDIQHLLNKGRIATVNSARITEVKADGVIKAAAKEDIDFFIARKEAYDPQTGLNFYDDERIIRAREAMILAVQSFNSPTLKFKTEQFAVQANIAWTYLLHEYFSRRGVKIVGKDGRSLLLSQMIKRHDFPLKRGVANNIRDMIDIRDAVEHKLLRRSDNKFFTLFQACCLNFDTALRTLFGEKLSLQHELSLALQFSKLTFGQVTTVQKYDVPEYIEALDSRLEKRLNETERQDLDYRFRVVYTLDNTSKSKAHFEFINPKSEEGVEIHNILEKRIVADDDYPLKPATAAEMIGKKAGVAFSVNNHTQAWKKYKARPASNAKEKHQTNKEYCIYHKSHGDYTYSLAWVDFVVSKITNKEEFEVLKKIR